MKHQFCIALGGLLTVAFMGCQQNTTTVQAPKVLGLLEVAFNDSQIGAARFIPAKLGTQAILNESQLVFTPTGVATFFAETNAPRNFDYVSRNFTITNNTGASINNLTLVALAKTGNLGGTAIKSATAFNGSTADAATAQLARPTHTMKANAATGGVLVDTEDISRASFQALTATEALAIKNDSNFTSQGLTGTVLEYGFVATNAAGTGRSIANLANGKVSIAMRFPKPNTATGVYNFVMTFAVTTETANRVTRSPEETTTAANSRATALGASQKVLIDDPAVITGANLPTGYTVQNNVKIGTGTSQTLLKKPAKLVLARVSAGGGFPEAPYTQDFVEIFNTGEFSASLNGKSLQFANNNNSLGVDVFSRPSVFDVSFLAVVSPGTYKLISGRGESTPPAAAIAPTAETSANWGANFQFAIGSAVGLVNQTTALNCGSTANPCSTAQNALILDLLGFKRGTNQVMSEGTVFAYSSQSGSLAFSRKNNGCLDTNDNIIDFFEETITNTSARNSSTTPFICP
jgi:hypothetical protein